MEAHDVVAEARAAAVEELAPGAERGEHAGDVVGRSPHEAERRLGPEAVDAPPRAEILRRARHEPHVAVPRAGRRIGEGERRVVRRGLRAVVGLGDAPDRLGERRVLGDVVDALAVEKHGPPVPETRDIRGAATHERANLATGGE